jgi:hypothetical protein
MKNIEKEVKKLIENLEKGKKIQIEYDSKNGILKAWELKLHRIDLRTDKMKTITDLNIGDFVTDGEEWAEVKRSSESGVYIGDKYYAYRGRLDDGSLEQFGVSLNQLITVSDFDEENEV